MEKTFRRKMLFAGIGIIVLIAVLIVAVREYKQEKGPIKIGMVTTLTGGTPTSGMNARDGVLLAVEKINSLEGINGRPVELIVKDDKRNFKQALRVYA